MRNTLSHEFMCLLAYLAVRDGSGSVNVAELLAMPAEQFDALLLEAQRWANAGRMDMNNPPAMQNYQWDEEHINTGHIERSETSDSTLALCFITETAQAGLRHVGAWGQWLHWSAVSGVWRKDETQVARRCMSEFLRHYTAKHGNGPSEGEGWNADKINSVLSASRVTRCLEYASAQRGIAVSVEAWDRDQWLLNTPAGIVDLRTGAVGAHDPALFLSKLTAVAPRGDCPLWRGFLDRITDGDKDLQSFLKRLAGYCLTGTTDEDAFFFSHGEGKNGKTTFWETIADVMGDYAVTVPSETFMVTHNEPHPTVLAKMQGARLVRADEIEKDQKWALAKLKLLTGGGKISARFMRQDFFEYLPQFKLCLSGNHKPAIGTVDTAIRRRLNLLPFRVTIPDDEVDKGLSEKLRKELPGILKWMIQGCLEWQSVGLRTPACVTDATSQYLAEQDASGLGRWIQECCVVGADRRCSSTMLYEAFINWAKALEKATSADTLPGDKKLSALSQTAFVRELKQRGYEVKRTQDTRSVAGLTLKADAGEKQSEKQSGEMTGHDGL